jgi:hypothetical protein
MTMRQFIKDNRQEIDQYIKKQCSNIGTLNDTERSQWISNDEYLYLWAKSEKVRV